jgi:hypothetical protein
MWGNFEEDKEWERQKTLDILGYAEKHNADEEDVMNHFLVREG